MLILIWGLPLSIIILNSFIIDEGASPLTATCSSWFDTGRWVHSLNAGMPCWFTFRPTLNSQGEKDWVCQRVCLWRGDFHVHPCITTICSVCKTNRNGTLALLNSEGTLQNDGNLSGA